MRGGDRPKNAHAEFHDVTVLPRSMYEPWLLFRKPLEGRVQDNLRKWRTGGLRRVSDAQPFGDVIQSSPTRPEERRFAPHPSLKSQAFLRQVVRTVLPLGEGIVIDPFAGSGSTLAAASRWGTTVSGSNKTVATPRWRNGLFRSWPLCRGPAISPGLQQGLPALRYDRRSSRRGVSAAQTGRLTPWVSSGSLEHGRRRSSRPCPASRA